MADGDDTISFETARQQAGLSAIELWLAYFSLGGLATPGDLESILAGRTRADRRDHDLLSLALNERFLDMDLDHPMPYFSQVGPSNP